MISNMFLVSTTHGMRTDQPRMSGKPPQPGRPKVQAACMDADGCQFGPFARRVASGTQRPVAALLQNAGRVTKKGVRIVAQRVVQQLIDDLDGSEAVKTVRFGYAGREYEIDLNEEHAQALDELLAPYLEHARRADGGASTRRTRRGGRSEGERRSPAELRAIRQWAREQGLQISDRGRIPADIVAKYDAAH